jgi:addiction module HigA family antidote
VIVSRRDKRTRGFAGVKRVKAFSGFERSARLIVVPTNRVTQILSATRAITGDTALRLAHFFGTSAQFWLNLQSLYDLRIAQAIAGKSIDALPRLKRHNPVHAEAGGAERPCLGACPV